MAFTVSKAHFSINKQVYAVLNRRDFKIIRFLFYPDISRNLRKTEVKFVPSFFFIHTLRVVWIPKNNSDKISTSDFQLFSRCWKKSNIFIVFISISLFSSIIANFFTDSREIWTYQNIFSSITDARFLKINKNRQVAYFNVICPLCSFKSSKI